MVNMMYLLLCLSSSMIEWGTQFTVDSPHIYLHYIVLGPLYRHYVFTTEQLAITGKYIVDIKMCLIKIKYVHKQRKEWREIMQVKYSSGVHIAARVNYIVNVGITSNVDLV